DFRRSAPASGAVVGAPPTTLPVNLQPCLGTSRASGQPARARVGTPEAGVLPSQNSLCLALLFPIVSFDSAMKVFIDGKFCDERDAKVSVFDHGLLYGDGIFEGIRAYNGRVFRLKEHIDRLFYSAKAILLTIPMSHEKLMEAVIE